MTATADDRAVEEAFEALLAGRPVPGEAGGDMHAVAAFAGAVREVADRPGRPNAALAELLADGLLTDLSSPSTRTAVAATSPRRRAARGWKRSRVPMFLSALIVKFLSAGAVAQAATGAGIVVVAFTGAGAVGVLPGSLQETFSDTVGIESPVPVPGNVTFTDGDAETTDADTAEETDGDTTGAEETAPDVGTDPAELPRYEPELYDSFGQYVSMMARHGGVDGAWISEQARNKHRQSDAEDEATETEAPTDGESAVTDEPDGESTVEPTDRGGNGNDRGKSNGNRGNGDDGDRGNGNRGNDDDRGNGNRGNDDDRGNGNGHGRP